MRVVPLPLAFLPKMSMNKKYFPNKMQPKSLQNPNVLYKVFGGSPTSLQNRHTFISRRQILDHTIVDDYSIDLRL